jgi:hypothetical protein
MDGFGQTFPSWLPVLQKLGFEAVLVLHLLDKHLVKVEAVHYIVWL